MVKTRFLVVASVLGSFMAACGGNDSGGGSGGGGAAGSGGTGGTAGAAGASGTGGQCPQGFMDCDGNPKTVCEAALASDPDNCGACGTKCPAGANQEPACSAGKCTLACAPGFADCNATASDGCEVELAKNQQNCGVCGRDCGASACSAGTCEVTTLASGLASPIGLAADATHVYFATFVPAGAVARVQKAGGTVEILASSLPNAFEVATDDSDVFATAQGTPPAADGSLIRVPKSGGTPTVLASARVGASELCLDGQYVYWAETYSATPGATIQRMLKTGGSISQVAAAEKHIADIRVYDGKLYWLTMGTGPDFLDGAVVRSELDGTARTVLVSGIARAGFELGLEAPSMFFGSRTSSSIQVAPLGGGSAQALVPVPGDQRTLEVDQGAVFYTTGTSGTVERVPASGGPPLVLAKGQLKAFDIVVDAESVYWSDAGLSANDGAIRKTAR